MDRFDHFLVLGAGASFGARDPPHRPPLGPKLADYLLTWLTANDPGDDISRRMAMEAEQDLTTPAADLFEPAARRRLREFLDHAVDSSDFESAARRLIVGRRQLEDRVARSVRAGQLAPDDRTAFHQKPIEEINRLVAFAMLGGNASSAFARRPDRFDELLSLPTFRGRIAVISLNYDILLEEALIRSGRSWGYRGPRRQFPRPGGIPVFKLHGSINWQRLLPVGPGRTLSVGLAGHPLRPDTGHEEVQIARPNIIAMLKHSDHPPVLATYSAGKEVDSNWGCIEGSVRSCLRAIRRSPGARATLFGVRLPASTDDPRLERVARALQVLRGQKEFVNPGEDERAAAESLGFEPRERTLGEYLEARARAT
ncbi:MAG TPA: hypothetical protein VMB50_03705 [Myxococcales bacterium]|nr:hypothetical protein [Myxococcales bacterium]